MTDLTMKDSAAPTTAGPITDIILIYVGGDTPDPWSDAQIAAQPEKFRFPTWVRSNPAGFSGSQEGSRFASWLHDHNVPKGATVCLDLETAVDTVYVNAFNGAIRDAGFKLCKYGSRDFIFQNPKTDGGTFVADPTGQPHMITEGDTVATQYAFDGSFDLSLVLPSVPLWPKSADPDPPPPPPPLDTFSVSMPELSEGATDTAGSGRKVVRLQALCTALGNPVALDGIFGPGTLAAVKAQQAAFGLSVDGIVGPVTWQHLIDG